MSQPTGPDLVANLTKATETTPQPAAKPRSQPAKAAKPKAEADKKPKPPKAPATVPTAPLPVPVQPGAKCQNPKCHGRYSILSSRRVNRQLVHDLICRTCQTKPTN